MTSSLLQQALQAQQSGDLAEAEKLLREILNITPKEIEARYHLGMVYAEQGQSRDAVRELSLTLQDRPTFGDAWFALSDVADHIDQYELSRFAGEQAVRLMPQHGRAWQRYGLALNRSGQNAEAISAYDRAVALEPGLTAAWINLSVALMNEGRAEEAEAASRKAIESVGQNIKDETSIEIDEKDYSLGHWHLALAELALGKYLEGFAHFRARYKGSTDWKRLNDPRPIWKGEDLKEKTILVRAEQGHGDALMFSRYVPMLQNLAARVIFQVHPALVPLFEGWSGAHEVLSLDTKVEQSFDVHTTIFDLPYRFKTTLQTVPHQVPYLPVLPKVDVPSEGQGRNIGVLWAGQQHPSRDLARNPSIPLREMASLFDVANCNYFNLTTDFRKGEKEMLATQRVTDLSTRITNFADTAQLLDKMDLVITCDTALAHLAGGLGKKVFTLLPLAPDWRWMLNREDTPWYPNMRLFRQTQRGVWSDVIARVKETLKDVKQSG